MAGIKHNQRKGVEGVKWIRVRVLRLQETTSILRPLTVFLLLASAEMPQRHQVRETPMTQSTPAALPSQNAAFSLSRQS